MVISIYTSICVRDCSENPGIASLFGNMFDRLPRSARNDGL
ncbi:MAG TPA: hypothetical protein VIO43_11440 [Lutibacter sp.]